MTPSTSSRIEPFETPAPSRAAQPGDFRCTLGFVLALLCALVALALPAVAHAVAGRIPVLLDGGVRRGTDVAKALALGASACLVGRPLLWGLSVAGEAGVAHVLEIYRHELDRVMGMCGAARLADLGADLDFLVGSSGHEVSRESH